MSARPVATPATRVVRLCADRVSIRIRARTAVVVCLLAIAAFAVLVLSLGMGDYPLTPSEVVSTLLGNGPPGADVIVETLRLPRALTALLVGAAFGISGALFQSLSHNPLGSPDIVGFTQGAAVGAVLEIAVLGGGTTATALGAIAGGLAVAGAVLALARRTGGTQGHRLVLIGIGFSALLAALTAFALTKVSLESSQGARLWLVGSLNGRGWEHVVPVAVTLGILLPVAAVLGGSLSQLELGDDLAGAHGVSVERARTGLVAVAVALAAVATAAAGPVAFVALAAPQIARRLTRAPGPGLAAAGLLGAVLLAVADLAAQHLVADTPLPVGLITGMVGGVYLVWLLGREWRLSTR